MEFTIINQSTTCCESSTGCCSTKFPTIIIGAGPIGLAAAAHLTQRAMPFVILEAGELAANVRSWQHVRLFSPWKYNMDKAAQQLLLQTNWQMPEEDNHPTGEELLSQYLNPLAALFKEHLYLNHQVVAITREQSDRMKSTNRTNQPFLVYVETATGLKTFKASAIIDATGTWGHPNPAISSGVFLPTELKLQEKIEYMIPNLAQQVETYANKKIAVIGSGHSAINSLLQLAALKSQYPEMQITWVMRKTDVTQALGGGVNDELQARGELGIQLNEYLHSGAIKVYTSFAIQALYQHQDGICLKASDSRKLSGFDRLIVNTGNRPNFDIHRELRYAADAITEAVPELATLIDPNLHSCGTVEAHGEAQLRQPEPNFYIVGAKSYGRAPTFLMATGYEQVRSVVAYLAGDLEGASNVQLSLPQTGVCHSGMGGCC